MTNMVYRKFHISITIGRYYFYKETKQIKIPKKIIPYLIGYIVSIPTVLLGFTSFRLWGSQRQGFNNAIKALNVNFAGGEDKTIENSYDEKTIHFARNLYRETAESIGMDNLEIIIEIIEHYENDEKIKMNYEKEIFLMENLKKLNLNNIRKDHIKEIIDTMDLLKKNAVNNFA